MPVQPAITIEYIPVSEFIRRAKERGVNFGFGDPYNRLRYYTKIGLLPHMTRRAVEWNEATVGHYPESALDTLVKIEGFKKQRLSNGEIKTRLGGLAQIEKQISADLPKADITRPLARRHQFAWALAGLAALFILTGTAYAALSPTPKVSPGPPNPRF